MYVSRDATQKTDTKDLLWIVSWALYTVSIIVNIYVSNLGQIENTLLRLFATVVYEGALGYIPIVMLLGYYGYCQRESTLKRMLHCLPFFIYPICVHVIRVILLDEQFANGLRQALFPLAYEAYGRVTILILVTICGEYLAVLAERLGKKVFSKLLAIMFVLWCLWPTFLGGDMYGQDVGLSVFAYLIGCYIAKYERQLLEKRYVYVWCSIVLPLIMMGGTCVLEYLGKYVPVNLLALVNMTSPIIYLCAGCMVFLSQGRREPRFVRVGAGLCMGAFAVYGNRMLSYSGRRLLFYFMVGFAVELIRWIIVFVIGKQQYRNMVEN